MKLVDLHIYGYGQLDDVKISNIKDFQVFIGENEAGKSTIMAFIHGILFGFPGKHQSDLRYEPKQNTKYGGKIRIFHEKEGYAVIERVKGKSAGDVKVSLENGTSGGEELLKKLLANFDKSLFQAIFSFNLHGLQNIHQMKGEEIGKFLFSTGALGTERLAKTEAILQKELDFRFKPNGKKPILNNNLQVIHELNGQLRASAAKNQEYGSLIERKETLRQEIEKMHATLKSVGEKIQKLSEWKKIEALVKEEIWTNKQLSDLGDIPFPSKGMERANQLKQLLHPYNAQAASLEERIKNLKLELETMEINPSILKEESSVLAVLDLIPVNEQLNQEKQQCKIRLEELEEQLSTIHSKLHLSISDEEALSINTNIYIRNQVEEAVRKGQKLFDAKEELEERYQDEKNALEMLEKDILALEGQLLTDSEKVSLEEQVYGGNDKKNLELELSAVKDQIAFYEHAGERASIESRNQHKQKKIQLWIFSLILAVIALYGIGTGQWILSSLSAVSFLFLLFFMSKSFRRIEDHGTNQLLSGLKEKERSLIEKLSSKEVQNIQILKEQLKKDQQRREQLQLLNIRLEQQHSHFDHIITKFEEWEKQEAQNKNELKAIGNELKIPDYMAHSLLLEALQLIEQYKNILRDKKHLHIRLEQINDEQLKIMDGIRYFADRYLSEKDLAIHQLAYLLRNTLKTAHEKQIIAKEKKNKLSDLEDDLEQLLSEQQHVQSQFNMLLHEANIENEEQFYDLGLKAEKKDRLSARLEDIQKQLQFSILNKMERESFLQYHDVDKMIIQYNDEISSAQNRIKALQEEEASVKYNIQVLEEGGQYAELLHQFKQKKFELEEEAKEWAVYCIAQELLSRTIEKFKKIHLPRMLAKAEEFLLFLTDGRYTHIHLHPSGSGFLIERNDYTLFEANELSQATTEQVYVSIRLALATTLYEEYCFPIIIDDSFVNFDEKRTKKVLDLLKQFNHNQVLFFTCHHHLLKHFQKENVILLEKGTAEMIS